jgi:spore cortex biosynthesis protein YabQ
MDLLFWIVTGLVVFAILLRADYAEIRIYTFIGISIGVFIYIKLFSEYVLKFFRWTFYLVGKTFRIIIVLIIMPFKVLYNILWSPVTWLKKTLSKALKGLAGVLKSPFRKKN